MKRDTILAALNAAKSSLVGVDFIPILSHFCFADGLLYAYNDVSAIVVDLDTGITGAVRGDMLIGVLQTCSEEITLSQKGEELTIETKNGKVTLPLLPEKEFIYKDPEFSGDAKEFPLTEGDLLALELCAQGTGIDPRRPEYIGITMMYGDPKAGKLYYSTDNITVSRHTLGKPKNIQTRFVLPKSTAIQILELAKLQDKKAGDPTILVSKTHAFAEFMGEFRITLVTKLSEYSGMDFDAILSEHVPAEGHFAVPEGIMDAVKRASLLMAKTAEKLAEVKVGKGYLNLYTKSDYGEAGANYSIPKEVLPAVSVVNVEMLERGLSFAAEMAVTDRSIAFRNATHTHVISSREE